MENFSSFFCRTTVATWFVSVYIEKKKNDKALKTIGQRSMLLFTLNQIHQFRVKSGNVKRHYETKTTSNGLIYSHVN